MTPGVDPVGPVGLPIIGDHRQRRQPGREPAPEAAPTEESSAETPEEQPAPAPALPGPGRLDVVA